MSRISYDELRQICRNRLIWKSIPQRISVTMFCTFGTIIINGLWSSTDRLLVAKRNTTEIGDGTQTHNTHEMLVLQLAFYIACVVTVIPAGIMSDKYGGKRPYLIGMITASILSFFFPLVAAYFSWNLLCSLMIFLGITQAISRTAEAVLVARWTPACERVVLGGFIFGAKPLGFGIGHMISWLAMRYIKAFFLVNLFWGTVGILWSILFAIIVYDEPQQDSSLSQKERLLLRREVPQHTLDTLPPWREALKSKCVWALIVGQIGHEAIKFVIILPLMSYTWWFHKLESTYDAYKTTASDVDCLIILFTSVALWITGAGTGMVVDYGVTHLRWHVRRTRIIPMCIAFILPNTFLVIMVVSEYDFYFTRIYYVVAVTTKGPFYSSFHINYMDITANFCGFVVALSIIGGELLHLLTIVCITGSEETDWHTLFWTLLAISSLLMTFCVAIVEVVRPKWDFSQRDWEDMSRRREVTFDIRHSSENVIHQPLDLDVHEPETLTKTN